MKNPLTFSNGFSKIDLDLLFVVQISTFRNAIFHKNLQKPYENHYFSDFFVAWFTGGARGSSSRRRPVLAPFTKGRFLQGLSLPVHSR